MSKIQTISSDKIKIDFVPSCGGSISAFKFFNGQEWVNILREAEQGCFDKNQPLDSSSFPLFPFSNRIAYGNFSFEEKSYFLLPNMLPEPHSIHGLSWQKEALISDYSANYIKIVHQQSGDDYPFHFYATQEWKIYDQTFVELKLKTLNTGKHAMPFGMGIHPYFSKTLECSITAETRAVMLNDDEMIPVSISKIPSEFNFSKGLKISESKMDNCYLGWNGDCAIKWPELNTELKLQASDIFGNMVVYIPQNDPFFCLEPVTNINDAHNNNLELPETGLTILQSGESIEGVINFRLYPIN